MNHQSSQQNKPYHPEQLPEVLQEMGISVENILTDENLEITDQVSYQKQNEYKSGNSHGDLAQYG